MDLNEGAHGSEPELAGVHPHKSPPACKRCCMQAEPTPWLIPAKTAAALCGVSRATWWRYDTAGLIPAPIRRRHPRSTMWNLAELLAWVDAGCPTRVVWEARLRRPRPETSNRRRTDRSRAKDRS
jgi:predicted DNA-binding transcriptional regulator AlpA